VLARIGKDLARHTWGCCYTGKRQSMHEGRRVESLSEGCLMSSPLALSILLEEENNNCQAPFHAVCDCDKRVFITITHTHSMKMH